jgi:hypothetical protein
VHPHPRCGSMCPIMLLAGNVGMYC